MCYFFLNHFSFLNSISIFSVCFVFLTFKLRSFKNSILLFSVILICCARINYKPISSLPSNYYKIERIVKGNQEKTVFIGRGEKTVIFILKRKENQQKLFYPNDIIEYKEKLMPLPSPKKLNDFVYAEYLRKIGVDSMAYLTIFPKVVFRDTFSVVFLASKLRQSIISYLLSFSKVTRLTRGVSIALLTGDKSFLDKNQYKLFRESGVIHVLAISGLHVGILYVTLCFLFSKLFLLPDKAVFYSIAILLIGYAFITGLSPSVIRAVLMFILIHYGKSFQKSVSTLNIIFSSATLMLFYNPNLIIDVGFQLSYSAVIGIVLIMQYSACKDWFSQPYLTFFWKIILVNLAAFLFTAPVISFHFGVVNFTSIWASVIIVPIITVGMYLALAVLIVSFNQGFSEKVFLTLDYLFFGVNKILMLITEHLHLNYHLFISVGVLIICFSGLILFVTKKIQWFIIPVFIYFSVSFLPRNYKIQFLKVNEQIQLKFNNELIHIKKGDKVLIEDIEVFYKEKYKLSLEMPDSTNNLDFNVNNYQYLNIEF